MNKKTHSYSGRFAPAWATVAGLSLSLIVSSGVFAQVEIPVEDEPQPVVSASAIPLSPQFAEGQIMVFEHQATINGSQAFNEDAFPNTAKTHMVMRIHIEEVREDGSASGTLTYDRVAMSGNAFFGGEFRYDSAEGPLTASAADVASALQAIKDATIRVEIGADGKVASLDGNMPLAEGLMQVPQLSGRSGELADEGLSQMLESFWLVGSEPQEREMEEAWEEVHETVAPGLGPLTVTTAYKMSEREADNITIDLELSMDLEIAPPDPEDPTQTPIEEADLVLDKKSGKITWDASRRQLLKRVSNLSFILTVKQKPLFGEEEWMFVTTTQDVSTTLTRIATE